jgi:hypothetical protein
MILFILQSRYVLALRKKSQDIAAKGKSRARPRESPKKH